MTILIYGSMQDKVDRQDFSEPRGHAGFHMATKDGIRQDQKDTLLTFANS
jgi:hypothetical protein